MLNLGVQMGKAWFYIISLSTSNMSYCIFVAIGKKKDMGSEDPNSSPHIYATTFLPTEPSLQLLSYF